MLIYGHIVSGGACVDEVLLTVMRAPQTYTREDIVEVNCHGGTVAVRAVLGRVLEEGARLAEPGEFTRRAFANGRIDLAQAEAVLDVVRARSERSLQAAVRQLGGSLSARLDALDGELAHLMALLEAGIDFPEEDMELPGREQLAAAGTKVEEALRELVRSAEVGVLLREGASVVIVGKQNVGKSSLMNALLARERTIVTPVPGTTRDVVEESITLEGVPVRLCDSAGLASPRGAVAAKGMEKTLAYVDTADLVVLVVDGSRVLGRADRKARDALGTRPWIAVINKADLPQKTSPEAVRARLGTARVTCVSALTGDGMGELRRAVAAALPLGGSGDDGTELVTNVRHQRALAEAADAAAAAVRALESGLPEEFAAADLRRARDAVGAVLGRGAAGDVLDAIFREFCIGK